MSDIGECLYRQQLWSKRTFGGGRRTLAILKHIRKELAEIEAQPEDLEEWVDVIILAMEGYWRHGGLPGGLLERIQAKQAKNRLRQWPVPQSEDEPSEHIR